MGYLIGAHSHSYSSGSQLMRNELYVTVNMLSNDDWHLCPHRSPQGNAKLGTAGMLLTLSQGGLSTESLYRCIDNSIENEMITVIL